MYESEYFKKKNKLIPIVYQSIYSFPPYDKYPTSKFFIIDTLSSFDTIYKTNIYVQYNKIAKLFLDWLIDININKNEYEDKYKKLINNGLFFIRLTTNVFDTSVISKELYYELKYLNLYIYLCNSFIYLLDPYYIDIISKKIKKEFNIKTKNYIIYDFLKRIFIIRDETFEFVDNIIENQHSVIIDEMKELVNIYKNKINSYIRIEYVPLEIYCYPKEFFDRIVFSDKSTDMKINTFAKSNDILYIYDNEESNFIEYIKYTIDIETSTKILNEIDKKKYADFVFQKTQVAEIINIKNYILFIYENKKLILDYEYYNFYTPVKVYPNKYYAFLYYGRSNQFENDPKVLLVIYNELLTKIKYPYFYFFTTSYKDFFIQLIGFILLYCNTSFDKFLDNIKIIDLYYDKENEYLI
jgi:hypothetical protein